MNERILKIESKAWEQVKRTNGLVRTEDFNQKFAELIVRECADTVLGFCNQFGDSAHAEIREHFGIKQ